MGDCISFQDLSNNSPTNWTWYFNGSSQPTVAGNPSPTNICYNTAGTFAVKLVVENSSGSGSLEITSFITVLDNPTVTTSQDTSICEESSATISASGGAIYQWDNGLVNGPVQIVSPILTTTYHVVVLDNNGCTTNDSVLVSVDALPNITTSGNTSICAGTPVTLSAAGTTNYQWNDGLGNTNSIVVSPTENTTYTVTGIDANGCESTEAINVSIITAGCLNIPSAFTPNGDGQNDVWNITGLIDYPDIKVAVYNRWGSEVYNSEVGYPSPWDGTYNGGLLPAATYYYVIELGNGFDNITGTINTIR